MKFDPRMLGVYDPPRPAASDARMPSPAAVSQVGSTFEVIQTRLQAPPQGPAAGEQLLFVTSRRWRGVDVYVAPECASQTGDFWVRVYAVDDYGGRSLVASGFGAASLPGLPAGQSVAEWAAAARGIASRWAVTVQTIATAPAVLASPVQFVAVASDEVTAAPEDVGVRTRFDTVSITLPFGIQDFEYSPQIVALAASNDLAAGAGTDRWIQLLSGASVGAAAGAAPIWSLPMHAVGPPVILDSRALRRIGYRGTRGCIVGVSSTPQIFTAAAAGDCHFTVQYR